MYHIVCILSSVEGHLGSFQLLAIINKAAMNIVGMYPYYFYFHFQVLDGFVHFFTCLLVFSYNSLRDFCVSSLRASTYLPVFPGISLWELFMSILKSSISIMSSDFKSKSCFCSVLSIQDWVQMMPYRLGFCWSCSCVCILPYCYLSSQLVLLSMTVVCMSASLCQNSWETSSLSGGIQVWRSVVQVQLMGRDRNQNDSVHS